MQLVDIVEENSKNEFRNALKRKINNLWIPQMETYRRQTSVSGGTKKLKEIFSILITREIPDPPEICFTCKEYMAYAVYPSDETTHNCLENVDIEDEKGHCPKYKRARYQ